MSAKLKEIYLRPCDCVFTGTPCKITTVLGSCVAVTFFYPQRGPAAIIHALLPRYKDKCPQLSGEPGQNPIFRFVDSSIRHVIRCFDDMGVDKTRVRAKIFGGAKFMIAPDRAARMINVGELNAVMAQEELKLHNIEIQASDVGGGRGRKIFFLRIPARSGSNASKSGRAGAPADDLHPGKPLTKAHSWEAR